MTRDTTTRATADDRVLYTATAHNRTGPDGESRTDGGLRVAVRSPLAPRPTAEAAETDAAVATDPEELLALAWATCLSGSARIVAPGRDVSVRVEVDLVEDPTGTGFAFEPTAYVSFSGTTQEQAERLAQQAHERCHVSKLLTGRGTATVVGEAGTSA
ncbi:MAG TPA: OsmC family protein [Brevibacterium sp.]|nr:OsmC family protein [Brevibacterium sp.]